jgi:hypothetical protein
VYYNVVRIEEYLKITGLSHHSKFCKKKHVSVEMREKGNWVTI